MNMFPSTLAYKYARAFLNVTPDITPAHIQRIETFIPLLKKHRQTLLYLTILHQKYESKYGSLDQFLNAFSISEHIKKLVQLLIDDKRLIMLPQVLKAITVLYKADHNIVPCTVTSAATLPEAQKAQLESLLISIVRGTFANNAFASGTLETHYQIDTNLIAGLRIETDTILYEHSVEKQLRQANLLLVRNYRGY